MANIHVYNNNPTLNGTDGTQVSENDNTNPITSVTAIEQGKQSEFIKLAIRTDTGHTDTQVTVSFTGTNASRWFLSTDGVNLGSTLNFANITATNTIFYAVYKADSSESAGTDTSVKLNISCVLA